MNLPIKGQFYKNCCGNRPHTTARKTIIMTKLKEKVCLRKSCFKEFTTYYDQKCCSQTCAQLLKSDIKLENWLNGDWDSAQSIDGSILDWARRYLMEKVQYRCSKCCWSEVSVNGTIPLEIDHIDGNWKNSHPDNLRILCPNCHGLTANYKIYNVGNNQNSRYSYFRERGWH